MSASPADTVAPTASGDPASFTLQVMSPSHGVPQPLTIQRVPAATTVKELKQRMRNMLPTHPPDEAQRFIHRGRLLAREQETMETIFGDEAIRGSDPLALHLVLRDPEPRPTPTSSVPISGITQPLPPGSNPFASQQPQRHIPSPSPQVPGLPNPTMQQPTPPPGGVPGAAQPESVFGRAPNNLLEQRRLEQRTLLDYMQAHRDQHPQSLLNARMHGNQDGHHLSGLRSTPGFGTPGRTASPLQPDGTTRTVVRETMGPNGQQWRVTVNESMSTRPGRTGSPFSNPDLHNIWRPPNAPGVPPPRSTPGRPSMATPDLQNIFQQADAGQATRAMTDAMRRNASTSSLASLASGQPNHPIPPGVTVPSRTASAAGTPDPYRAAGFGRSVSANHRQVPQSLGNNGPEVYILYSENGPRALLFNNNSETYYSPQGRTLHQPAGLSTPGMTPFPVGNTWTSHFQVPQPLNSPIQRNPHGGSSGVSGVNTSQAQQPQQPQGEAQAGAAQQARPQAVAQREQPHVQAIRVHQLWPHVWMIIRLGFFIWWFTSPTSSWSRWFTVVSIAVALFLANTGAIDPLTDHIWVPLRRLLENLIPLADGAGDANADAANAQPHPDPVEQARLERRRRRTAPAHWIEAQMRRLERAGLLFLASIAPGVAERHIAQVEAEARAQERLRQERLAQQAEEENQRRREAEAESQDPAAASSGAQDDSSAQDGENNEAAPIAV